MPYRLSSRAERDLDEVGCTSPRDASPTTADRLIDAIVDRFDSWRSRPGWVDSVPRSPGVHSISVENHVIYYRHDGEVQIARVLHGRRDQAVAWFDPSDDQRNPVDPDFHPGVVFPMMLT